jgi:hypothetical protein
LGWTGFQSGVIPELYLEKISLVIPNAPKKSKLLLSNSDEFQVMQCDLNTTNPLIREAEPGDIFRFKCVIPSGSQGQVDLRNIYLFIPSVLSGIPPVRLSFEEFVERKSNVQTLEMRSWRSWMIQPEKRGWMNTTHLTAKPCTIVLDMDVELCPVTAPTVQQSFSGSETEENSIILQLIRGIKRAVIASVVVFNSKSLISMNEKMKHIHFEIELYKSTLGESNAMKLLTLFREGDYYQIETRQFHCQITMKISQFRLTITSRESIGFNWYLVKSLSHQTKYTQDLVNHKQAHQQIVDEEDSHGFVDYQGNYDNVEDVKDPTPEKWIYSQKGIFGFPLPIPGKLHLAPIDIDE